MHTYTERMDRIMLQTAEEAWARPLLASGLWHHNDIRNNFYDAAYLFAAATEKRFQPSFGRDEGAKLAKAVLMNVLALQDKNPESPTFGHWPLHLGDNPQLAEKNTLPVELMGCLMIYWQHRYADQMDAELTKSFEQAIHIIYRSGYYRQPLQLFNHHEAKYTSAKLLFGYYYLDAELLASGRHDLLLTLERIRNEGMAEYGALPWFWHWIQSLTSAYACIDESGIRDEIASLLEELWQYRARHYLKGAWIGGRMRSLPVDLPRDRNVAFDYVQFGDFELPRPLARVEFAGLLHYEASELTRQAALQAKPEQFAYTVFPARGEAPLHQSIYRTAHAATGGILERFTEFDNEQHRWEITLPLTEAEGANRLYIFSPGDGFTEDDPRHESNDGELLLHKHAVVGLYGPNAGADRLVGVLPTGTWKHEDNRAYGELRHLYAAVILPGKLAAVNFDEYIKLDCSSRIPGKNGFVVEVVEKQAAAALGIVTLADFISAMERRKPLWELSEDSASLSVRYQTITGDMLELAVSNGEVVRTCNGIRMEP